MNGVLVATTLVVVVGIAIAGAAAADLGPFSDRVGRTPLGPCNEYEFDAQAWADTKNPNRSDVSDPGDLSPAQLQARQLIDCKSLVGMTRRDVLRQLGDPSTPRAHPLEARWFSYFLGISPDAFLLDDEDLNIRFDDSGRVSLVSLYAG